MHAVIVKHHPPREGTPDRRRSAIVDLLMHCTENKTDIDRKHPLGRNDAEERFGRGSDPLSLRGVGAVTKARLQAGGVSSIGDILDADDDTVAAVGRQGTSRAAFARLKLQAERTLSGELPDPLKKVKSVCPLCGEEHQSAGHLKKHMESDTLCFMRLKKPFVPRINGSAFNDVSCAGRHFSFETLDGEMAAGHFPGDDASVFVWCVRGVHRVNVGDWRDVMKKPIQWVMAG